MKVEITYTTKKTGVTRTKAFFRDSVKEAVRYFNWRYGHPISFINGKPVENLEALPLDVWPDPMVAGENCGAFMADGSRMV